MRYDGAIAGIGPMNRLCLALSLGLVAPSALANTVGCGDNAFTYAEVVEAKRGVRTKGPLTSVPDTLCADLIEDRPRQIESLSIQIGDGPFSSPTIQGPARSAPRR